MATKRGTDSTCTSCSESKRPKRQVTVATFQKWQSQQDKEYQTLCWLRCDKQHNFVQQLWCATCRKFEDKLQGVRNFSSAWINGRTNQKLSNVLDHAKCDQHKKSMNFLKTEKAISTNTPLTQYSTIAKSLLTLDESLQKKMEKKFDICFTLAKENLPFRKYPAIHKLEARHGVDLGQSYATKDSAKSFTHYIAQSQRSAFKKYLSTQHFFSILTDGTSDAGNVEDELFVVMSFHKDDDAREVRSFARYFNVEEPRKADALGLITCIAHTLKTLGVDNAMSKECVLNCNPILVGVGTDGASVNIGPVNGVKARMQHELPWLHWAWCYAHRLELACKNSFTSDLFKNISEMLLHLYYLYSMSPKKLRELTDIVYNLKDVYELPKEDGNAPIRSQGSRWISHKRQALQRVVDRYGIYIIHLTTLIADSSLNSTDIEPD